MELVDTIADTVRLVAQGRADAIVENIDFFMRLTKNYPDVKWVVLPDPIDVGYDAIGLQQGNYPLRDVLNIILYRLHSSNYVNETWGKWYGAPMLVKIVAATPTSDASAGGTEAAARCGVRCDELHVPARRGARPAAGAAGRRARHARAGLPGLLGRRVDRRVRRHRQDLRRADRALASPAPTSFSSPTRRRCCRSISSISACPRLGILLSSFICVLIGLTLNAGAYLTEIMRAGFISVRRPSSRRRRRWASRCWQQMRYVILPHVAKAIYPALANFFIVLVLGTSMAAVFGVDELTGHGHQHRDRELSLDRDVHRGGRRSTSC